MQDGSRAIGLFNLDDDPQTIAVKLLTIWPKIVPCVADGGELTLPREGGAMGKTPARKLVPPASCPDYLALTTLMFQVLWYSNMEPNTAIVFFTSSVMVCLPL